MDSAWAVWRWAHRNSAAYEFADNYVCDFCTCAVCTCASFKRWEKNTSVCPGYCPRLKIFLFLVFIYRLKFLILKKTQGFGSLLCFRLQLKKSLNWWASQIELLFSPWVTQWLKGNLLPLLPANLLPFFQWSGHHRDIVWESNPCLPVLFLRPFIYALSYPFLFPVCFDSFPCFPLFYLHFYSIYFPSFLLLLFIPLSWKNLQFFYRKNFSFAPTQCHSMHCLLRKRDVTWFRCQLQFAHQLNSCVTLTSQNLFVQYFKVGYAGPGLLIIFSTASCCRNNSVVEPAT